MFSFHDYLTSASKLMVLMQTVSTSSSSSWARTAQPGGYGEKSTLWQGTSLWHSYWEKHLIKKAVSGNWSADEPQILLRESPRSAELLQKWGLLQYLQHSRGWHEQQGHHCSGPLRGSLSRGSTIISINNKKKSKKKKTEKTSITWRDFLYIVLGMLKTQKAEQFLTEHIFPNATILVTCKFLQGSSNPMQCYLKSRNQTAQQRPWKMHSE